MPSITFWNRIEPSPRSDRLERHVAAQVRDPMWFLARQWQFGEFQGEDAATPAYVELAGRVAPIIEWFADAARVSGFDNAAPLEELVETEGFTPDWATAVEIGQYFEQLLIDAGLLPETIDAFRAAYPVPAPDTLPETARDHELRRFLIVCHGRATDGLTLLAAIRAAEPALPAQPALPAGVDPAVVLAAATEFDAWVRATFGDISRADADAWRADRFEYRAGITAVSPQGAPLEFNAFPSRDGTFDWYAFDQVRAERQRDRDPRRPRLPEPRPFQLSVLPTRVTFPGMPDLRWWHFEDNQRNLGELRAGRLELGKLVVLDFMLVHGDDWYVLPFAQDVGTLCGIDALLVHDVFGETTLVPRADADAKTPWTMFTVEVEGGGRGGYFLLPPSASGASLRGDAIEEVRLVRDEMANMAWGIEKVTESGLGTRWPGHERADRLGSEPIEYVPAAPDAPPLKYLLQTRVPEHWIPLIPRQVDAARRSIALQRAAALRPPQNNQPAQPILPMGRILNPSNPAHAPNYLIAEEEVPREGSDVARRVERCRWIDGSTHIWIARSRRPGAGEGSSGLRFDLALEARQRKP